MPGISSAMAGDLFVYFKHEDSPQGALYAEELLAKKSVLLQQVL